MMMTPRTETMIWT
ncbi:hypothetical protein E2C01_044671 [Portunus trituberculatus]|uniref:Uncharacterized protein n=1 Tax=Portunus trituberculatus TaxID=210409 RepID=A0A5B7FZT2_PORTR|nr:hypothetical protein [Portunus trituberculatus]